MVKKGEIDVIYRSICLVTFCLVILFSRNLVTLGILLMFFFFMTKKENNLLYVMLFFFCSLSLLLIYSSDVYYLTRIILVISYLYYFLFIPSVNDLLKSGIDRFYEKRIVSELCFVDCAIKNDEDEQKYIEKKEEQEKNDLPIIIYITSHMVLLIFAIVMGGVI